MARGVPFEAEPGYKSQLKDIDSMILCHTNWGDVAKGNLNTVRINTEHGVKDM